uniref:Uncharacterized protein n=1 Tax=Hippocampus comes TaxID=109280 RepID=A0A3Q2Z0M3_HIPCM
MRAFAGLGHAARCMQVVLSTDKSLEAEASDVVGGVYQLMADYETAQQWHQRALDMAEQTGCVKKQTRAYGNLGATYEALGNYERALVFQEQHLSMAAQTNNLVAKTVAYGSLGRIHHALGNYTQAVMYLQEGEEFNDHVKTSAPLSSLF